MFSLIVSVSALPTPGLFPGSALASLTSLLILEHSRHAPDHRAFASAPLVHECSFPNCLPGLLPLSLGFLLEPPSEQGLPGHPIPHSSLEPAPPHAPCPPAVYLSALHLSPEKGAPRWGGCLCSQHTSGPWSRMCREGDATPVRYTAKHSLRHRARLQRPPMMQSPETPLDIREPPWARVPPPRTGGEDNPTSQVHWVPRDGANGCSQGKRPRGQEWQDLQQQLAHVPLRDEGPLRAHEGRRGHVHLPPGAASPELCLL